MREHLREQVAQDARERGEMAEKLGGLMEASVMRALGRFFRRD